jgi:transposase
MGIFWVLRLGAPWRDLPQEITRTPPAAIGLGPQEPQTERLGLRNPAVAMKRDGFHQHLGKTAVDPLTWRQRRHMIL